MRNAAIVVVMLSVAVPVFGDQLTPNPQVTARLGALRPAQPSNPYRDLFTAQDALKNAVTNVQPKPKIVCGMTVIPADPKIDPKMGIAPKQGNMEYKMRAIEPPICRAGE